VRAGSRRGSRPAPTRSSSDADGPTLWSARCTAVFTSNAFERRFRDIHTVAQQLQGRDDHFENVGRFLLVLEPDTTFL
jgi:hypothetical protein